MRHHRCQKVLVLCIPVMTEVYGLGYSTCGVFEEDLRAPPIPIRLKKWQILIGLVIATFL